jgi:imidazolonepropionase-like amidohydrolase
MGIRSNCAGIAKLAMCAAAALLSMMAVAAAQQPITIRAGTLIDGRGGVQRNAVITIDGERIAGIGGGASGGKVTYDFPQLTVLPGLIDAHDHIGTHFGKDGRADTRGETPAEKALAGAANGYTTLMAGFTTIQSVGEPGDVPLRAAFAGGVPGPRLLTSVYQIIDPSLTLDQIRQFVRKAVADGADVIKLFATKSIREGGGQTMSDEQIFAACGEAKAQGKRPVARVG